MDSHGDIILPGGMKNSDRKKWTIQDHECPGFGNIIGVFLFPSELFGIQPQITEDAEFEIIEPKKLPPSVEKIN